MTNLRIGLIGAGHLGRIHAKLLSQVDGAELVAVAEPSSHCQDLIRKSHDVPIFSDPTELIHAVDAVIVASPTPTHTEIVDEFLIAGKHVFCEKPLTITAADSRRLAMAASFRRLTLQVGHVERFNPAFTALGDLATDVKYVEAVRASSFPGRCLDVGVVMDLMIHDLDLIRSMTTAPVASIHSSGIRVVSNHEDIAETRIEFECGLVANVKASRISPTATRSMQVYGPRGFAEIDFGTPSLSTVRTSEAIRDRSFQLSNETENPLEFRDQLFAEHLQIESQPLTPRNAILDELHDFVLSIQTGVAPTVDGHAGAAAVALAEQVCRSIEARSWYGTDSGIEIGSGATARRHISDRRVA